MTVDSTKLLTVENGKTNSYKLFEENGKCYSYKEEIVIRESAKLPKIRYENKTVNF